MYCMTWYGCTTALMERCCIFHTSAVLSPPGDLESWNIYVNPVTLISCFMSIWLDLNLTLQDGKSPQAARLNHCFNLYLFNNLFFIDQNILVAQLPQYKFHLCLCHWDMVNYEHYKYPITLYIFFIISH